MPSERPSGAFRAFAFRDFRLLLVATTLANLVIPVQFLSLVFWLSDEYPGNGVLFISIVSASRGAGMLLGGLFGGAIADHFQRRRVLLCTETASCSLTAIIGVVMLTQPLGEATIVFIFALTFFQSGNLAIDGPSRSAAMPSIVGMEGLSNAISLNMIAIQVALPLMVPLAGVLNGVLDGPTVYAGTLVAWVAVLPLMLALRFENPPTLVKRQGVVANIREGLAYSRKDDIILGVVLTVVALHVVGMPGVAALGPLWMTHVLGLSKTQFGIVGATWGLGALVASIVFAHQNHLMRRGDALCANMVVFAVAVIVFGHSRSVPLTAVANFTLGFTMAGVMVGSSMIAQHVTTEAFRGRVMALFPLVVGLGMLAALPVGVVARTTSLEAVVPALGWAMLALSIALVAGRPALRAVRAGAVAAEVPVVPAAATAEAVQ